MNRVLSFGLAIPTLLLSTSALAGEPPYPAPAPVIVEDQDDIDEEELREEIRKDVEDDIRDEVRRQLEEQEPEPQPEIVVEDDDEDVVIIDRGVEVPVVEQGYRHNISAGAGALGFIGDNLDLEDAAGPSWQVRYGYNIPRLVYDGFLTWEVAYTGSTDVDDGDVQMTATIFETGLKVNTIPNSIIYPIVTAGIGYGAWTSETNGFEEDDLGTLTLPFSAGFEVAWEQLLFNARATYRPVFFDENDVQFTEIGNDNWMVSGEIGTRF